MVLVSNVLAAFYLWLFLLNQEDRQFAVKLMVTLSFPYFSALTTGIDSGR